MSLKYIHLTRHGFRSNWEVNPQTGEYFASVPSPTGIATDPPLTGYGVQQSRELAAHLQTLCSPIQRVYSSPYVRCLETIMPTVEGLAAKNNCDVSALLIRGENGAGEWYGRAPFAHPSPAGPRVLKKLFPFYNEAYKSFITPSVNGETIGELYRRCAQTLSYIIEESDREGVETIIICTHAATLIAMGRVLTGRFPEDYTKEDFRPFTCSLTSFQRERQVNLGLENDRSYGINKDICSINSSESDKVVGDTWLLTTSGDCGFLSGGEERGWKFSSDESFDLTPINSLF